MNGESVATQAVAARGVTYLLGSSEAEITRLMRQGEILRPLTRRLFVEAGIGPGMRVLDLGSGAGGAALLAAELVGPAGEVVGIDRDPWMVAIARDRVRALGLRNVSFIEGEAGATAPPGIFDALVGRFILMYLPDPAAVIRSLLPHLRRGALVVFQEGDYQTSLTVPEGPLFRRVVNWLGATARHAGIERRMGPKLYPTLVQAGLPGPAMMADAIIGGGHDSPVPEILTEVVRVLLPAMTRYGVATEDEVEIETLSGRLWAEAVAAGGCIAGPLLIGAWSRVP